LNIRSRRETASYVEAEEVFGERLVVRISDNFELLSEVIGLDQSTLGNLASGSFAVPTGTSTFLGHLTLSLKFDLILRYYIFQYFLHRWWSLASFFGVDICVKRSWCLLCW